MSVEWCTRAWSTVDTRANGPPVSHGFMWARCVDVEGGGCGSARVEAICQRYPTWISSGEIEAREEAAEIDGRWQREAPRGGWRWEAEGKQREKNKRDGIHGGSERKNGEVVYFG
ncbi:hypothetical protein E2562_006440 [Oryza meyeriana var. granulata]|uniref:Uncharacterized protein n=1 Tax=Oryza meyeriana var. granulata TaxID=110450 RepID=A0A6G1CNR8_9ORYZ|nr:hypothetical protein E2562_006440 [Oryza meyeriana var. granulata]